VVESGSPAAVTSRTKIDVSRRLANVMDGRARGPAAAPACRRGSQKKTRRVRLTTGSLTLEKNKSRQNGLVERRAAVTWSPLIDHPDGRNSCDPRRRDIDGHFRRSPQNRARTGKTGIGQRGFVPSNSAWRLALVDQSTALSGCWAG